MSRTIALITLALVCATFCANGVSAASNINSDQQGLWSEEFNVDKSSSNGFNQDNSHAITSAFEFEILEYSISLLKHFAQASYSHSLKYHQLIRAPPQALR